MTELNPNSLKACPEDAHYDERENTYVRTWGLKVEGGRLLKGGRIFGKI